MCVGVRAERRSESVAEVEHFSISKRARGKKRAHPPLSLVHTLNTFSMDFASRIDLADLTAELANAAAGVEAWADGAVAGAGVARAVHAKAVAGLEGEKGRCVARPPLSRGVSATRDFCLCSELECRVVGDEAGRA